MLQALGRCERGIRMAEQLTTSLSAHLSASSPSMPASPDPALASQGLSHVDLRRTKNTRPDLLESLASRRIESSPSAPDSGAPGVQLPDYGRFEVPLRRSSSAGPAPVLRPPETASGLYHTAG